MAATINASTWIDLGGLAITGYPFTVSGWFRTFTTGSKQTFVEFVDALGTSSQSLLYGGHSGGWAAALSVHQGVAGAALSVSSIQTGVWHHLAGVFRAFNSRSIYFDGVLEDTSANQRNFEPLTQYSLGGISLPGSFDTAELGIWRSEVPSDQIAAMAAGVSPLGLPCRSDLVAYHDFIARGNRPGLGPQATWSQDPLPTPHPRVFSARRAPVFAQRGPAPGPFWEAVSQSYSAGAAAAEVWVAGVVCNDLEPSAEVIS